MLFNESIVNLIFNQFLIIVNLISNLQSLHYDICI